MSKSALRGRVIFSFTAAGMVAAVGCSAAGPATESPAAPQRGDLPVAAARDIPASPPSSAYLALLPEGEEKRKFILDCTGCHQFDGQIAFPGGQPRTQAQWEEVTRRMLGYAGASTPFPVISAERDPEATAQWLTQHLNAPPAARTEPLAAGAVGVQITEYPFPVERDLPHDLIVGPGGQVVITGMFSDRMWTLEPGTGRFAEVPIPVERANPRALELDAKGNWWVLLGAPNKIARYDPAAAEWRSWDIGMYAHELRNDGRGRVWFNGHFTHDPSLIGYVDPAADTVRTFAVPSAPGRKPGENPIPYGLRVAPDGTVWGTELHGNRIFRFSPETEEFRTYEMPTAHSGPRRPAFDAQGTFWIPEYATNKLARFDPRTERFTEYTLPIPDALPYIVEADPRSGLIWIGTGAADALVSFDPRTERFAVHPLPTRGALVRHIDIDRTTGDVWAAYGAAPGIPPKIARLSPPRPE